MKLETLRNLDEQLRPEAWVAVLAATVLLTLLGVVLYVLKPEVARYRELSRTWSPEALISAEVNTARRQAEIDSHRARLDEVRESIYGDASALPREQIESHVIAQLDHLARRRDVRLTSVKPGRAEAVLSFEEIPYDVDVSGDYFALHAWLGDVERELRPLAVKRFEMDRTVRESDRIRLQLRLVSYRPQEES